MDEEQVQDEAPKAWRETSDEKTSCKQWTPEEALRQRLYDKVRIKLPMRKLKIKMELHQDLRNRFARRTAPKTDADVQDEMQRRNKLNFASCRLQKDLKYSRRNLQNAAVLMKQDNEVSDLVSKIESTKFKITADPKVDFSIARGVSTMSCYDNVPRQPTVDMGEEITLESRPDVTQKLENVSIHCDTYHSDGGAIPKTLCMGLIDQTVSLDIGANGQNQLGSQLSVVDPKSLVDFCRRFREYCTNTINLQLNEALQMFVEDLSRLQRNLYNRDNVKGRFRRRFYAGFKETEKRLQLNKVKLAIIAPDLDKNKDNGELDELVHRFIDSCRRHEVPVVFGLSRRKLGYLTHGKGFVSCIGVANYESLESKLEEALLKIVEARNEFKILSGQQDKIVDMTKLFACDLLLSERVKVLLKTLTSQ